MLCQLCNKNNASIHYKTNVSGVAKEMYICLECAEKAGIAKKNVFEPIDLIDGFFGKSTDDIFGGLFAGMMNDTAVKNASEPKVCPVCGMRFSEFLNGGKLGCAECYKAFNTIIKQNLAKIQPGLVHVGHKYPSSIVGLHYHLESFHS